MDLIEQLERLKGFRNAEERDGNTENEKSTDFRASDFERPSAFVSNYYSHDYSLVEDAIKLIYDAAVKLEIAGFHYSYALVNMPILLGVHVAGQGYVEDENGRYCFRDALNSDGKRIRYSYRDDIVPKVTSDLRDTIETLRIEGNKDDLNIVLAVEHLQDAYFDKLCNYLHYQKIHDKRRYVKEDANYHLRINNLNGDIMLYGENYGEEEQQRKETDIPEILDSNFSSEGMSPVTLREIALKGFFVKEKNKRFAICPAGNNMTRCGLSGNGASQFYYPVEDCQSCKNEECIGKKEYNRLYFGKNTFIKDIKGKVLQDAMDEIDNGN